MMSRSALSLLLLVSLAFGGCDDGPEGSHLRLNELQALGTHNSYHILAQDPPDPALNYQHTPLPEQLDGGVRHFEIDIHRDAVTGDIAVYHIKSIDEGASCTTLAACLGAIRAWSDAHPHHHALVVLLEPKDDLARFAFDIGQDPAMTGELLWDGHIGDIDAVIRAAWPNRLLTPAAVRGRHATLREAIITSGWPTIDATRGQLAIVVNDEGALRTAYRDVLDPAAFVFAEPSDDDAAFVKADTPGADPVRLATALAAGFIARSRADGDTVVDPEETAAAIASGAQLISTDYPVARTDGAHPGYRIPWPGTPAHPSRCNPVTAPPDCVDADIE